MIFQIHLQLDLVSNTHYIIKNRQFSCTHTITGDPNDEQDP